MRERDRERARKRARESKSRGASKRASGRESGRDEERERERAHETGRTSVDMTSNSPVRERASVISASTSRSPENRKGKRIERGSKLKRGG